RLASSAVRSSRPWPGPCRWLVALGRPRPHPCSTQPESETRPMPVGRYRNVVLGAGAMGSAVAYHLARRGEPVLLVEQFALGHDRGSSHGAARITRHSYADPACARLMPAAFAAWRGLEADAGETLYVRTGGVSFGPAEVGYVAH